MIPGPWKLQLPPSSTTFAIRQGQGIVSPLHLKVIYGQTLCRIPATQTIIHPFKLEEAFGSRIQVRVSGIREKNIQENF
jgi:hypothetical protein